MSQEVIQGWLRWFRMVYANLEIRASYFSVYVAYVAVTLHIIRCNKCYVCLSVFFFLVDVIYDFFFILITLKFFSFLFSFFSVFFLRFSSGTHSSWNNMNRKYKCSVSSKNNINDAQICIIQMSIKSSKLIISNELQGPVPFG